MPLAAYIGFVIAVAAQRLLEMRASRRNEARLKVRGGLEHARPQLRVMMVLHGAWLACSILEVAVFDRPFHPTLAIAALTLFLGGQTLRYAGRRALGDRWTVSVITLPGAPLVSSGIFRHVRHPIYLGVAVEIVALPLVHSAWLTAAVFSLLNGAVLVWRIGAEERALGLRPVRMRGRHRTPTASGAAGDRTDARRPPERPGTRTR